MRPFAYLLSIALLVVSGLTSAGLTSATAQPVLSDRSVAPEAAATGQVLHVNATRSASGNGHTWEDAFRSLSAALASAEAGDEIWVAEGTYVPDGTDPAGGFRLVNGVSIYGGFLGFETRRTDANPSRYRTILSGDRNGDDDEGRFADNVYHVVIAEGVDRSTVLDGVTIRDGRTGWEDPHAHGAGVVLRDASPVLRRCVIRNNRSAAAGGGLALFEDSAPLIVESAVLDNVGSGMYSDGSRPEIRQSVVSGNWSMEAGGGILNVNDGHVLVVESVIDRNVADEGDGGGIATIGSRTTIVGSLIRGNSAPRGNGGAVLNAESTVRIVSSAFVANATGRGGGGGFANVRSDVDLINSVVTDNHARTVAGGSLSFGSQVNVRNSVVWENRAQHHPLQMVRWEHGEVAIGSSTVQHSGGSGAPYWDARMGRDADGNMERAPRFVRLPAPGPDGAWGTADDFYGDLRPSDVSPMLDAGNNEAVQSALFADVADLAGRDNMGQARIQNDVVDVGASEGTPRLLQPVRAGDRIRADSLGIRIMLRELPAPAVLAVTHHPVLRRGPEGPERMLNIPEEKQLAVPSRWTVDTDQPVEGLVADVCFPGVSSRAIAGRGVQVYKRPSAGTAPWTRQETKVQPERSAMTICAPEQTSFSEYVLLQDAPARAVRIQPASSEVYTTARLEALALANAPLGDGTSRPFALRSLPPDDQGRTAVRYVLSSDGNVFMALYDEDGRELRYTLLNGTQTAGPKEVLLTADPYDPGTYTLQINALGRSATHQITLAPGR